MAGGYKPVETDPLAAIGQQISDIWVAIRELQRPTGTQLASAVQKLQDQVAAIQALQANSIRTAVGADSASSFNVTTTSTTKSSFNVTVPDGFTQALIFCSGSATSANFSGTSDFMYVRCAINGTNGPEARVIVGDFNTSPYSNTVMLAAASYSRKLTGLNAGDSIAIELKARSGSGTFAGGAYASAQLAGQVIWLP